MAVKEWEKELYRYRLNPVPEKKPLQAFIELYLETGDETHFAHFLHYYEPALNDLAIGYVQEYAMQGHFADIKSACVYGLLRAMQGYEKEKGPFVPYARYEIKRAVDDYIRTMRTGFTVPTDKEYYLLRTAMRLYAEHDYKTNDETVALIAKKIHRKPERVREMLALVRLEGINVRLGGKAAFCHFIVKVLRLAGVMPGLQKLGANPHPEQLFGGHSVIRHKAQGRKGGRPHNADPGKGLHAQAGLQQEVQPHRH